MKIAAEYKQKVYTKTVKDFLSGTVLWISSSTYNEKDFPNCKLSLVLKTGMDCTGVVFLETGGFVECKYSNNWKAIEANVKIVNG
jgi:hypothetical protein